MKVNYKSWIFVSLTMFSITSCEERVGDTSSPFVLDEGSNKERTEELSDEYFHGFKHYLSQEVTYMNDSINSELERIYSKDQLKRIVDDASMDTRIRLAAFGVYIRNSEERDIFSLILNNKKDRSNIYIYQLGVKSSTSLPKAMVDLIFDIEPYSFSEKQKDQLIEIRNELYMN